MLTHGFPVHGLGPRRARCRCPYPRRRVPSPLTFTEQARRRQLVECTIDLISTHGLPATSLSAIAAAAGLSKAAFLYHFSSKDNLTRVTPSSPMSAP
ncbi:TetR/AcrR family transcriptional regulator [Streptomyces sp. NPDC017941]|uniref:TetR/AcrR family transcriptional regulator n=1 Tax=Streptomyces sp. NPDC017941 TaxID=3365018 RepID=UPI0037978289